MPQARIGLPGARGGLDQISRPRGRPPSHTIVGTTPEEIADLEHLRRARDFIDREYAQPLDVPAMASAALMSIAHRGTGATPRRTAIGCMARTHRSGAQLRSWFPCDVIVTGEQWEVGATISFPFSPDGNGMTLTGEVLAVDEPRMLTFRWGKDILRFELTESDGGTCLVLLDELPPGTAARNAAGWEVCLDRLSGVLAESADWQARFDRFSIAFEPILGHQVGAPSRHADV